MDQPIAGRQRFEAMGFGRHYDNLPFIGTGDILLPSIGGAGSTLLANLLTELGLSYVDLAKDILRPDGSVEVMTDAITDRLRLPAAEESHEDGRRFMKSHLPAAEFAGVPYAGVWLLVRDPRDAVYSWHKYHVAFGQADWELVSESFEEFLSTPFFLGGDPVDNWTRFNRDWLQAARLSPSHAVLRFEDLKQQPVKAMLDAFDSIGLKVDEERLEQAVAASSFTAGRAYEDRVAGTASPRILRAGKVDEWREWMTPGLAQYFAGEELRSTAAEFGYDLTTTARTP